MAKTPKPRGKESAGDWKGNQPEEIGAGKTPKTESRERAVGWEGNQPGGFGVGKTPKSKTKKARGLGKQPT